MLPYELRNDKDGLLYLQDDRILLHTPLFIDHREKCEERYYVNGFYRINSTDEYIIKYSYTVFTRKEIRQIKKMLETFVNKQNQVSMVDFPIGYFKSNGRLSGLIVKYYQDGMSLDNILRQNDLESLGKYYAHDDDIIHNIFKLFIDILDNVHEMFENDIYYMDINPGNIVLTNNTTKIIDFDYRFVKFDEKDRRLVSIMYAYVLLMKIVLVKYGLIDGIYEKLPNFEEAKSYTKKLENSIRRGR